MTRICEIPVNLSANQPEKRNYVCVAVKDEERFPYTQICSPTLNCSNTMSQLHGRPYTEKYMQAELYLSFTSGVYKALRVHAQCMKCYSLCPF